MPNYRPALGGTQLLDRLAAAPLERPALIEGLVYQRTVLLVSAEGGTGKSTLMANAFTQASCGLPVFSAFFVPKPLLCYYIPFERGSEEICERLKHIQRTIPFNADNLRIYDHDYIPDLLKPADQQFLLDSIKQDCAPRQPDIVGYDPIYQSVAGGLSNEDRMSIFTRFNTRLMNTFQCATWLNNHTTKLTYTSNGKPIEKDDPYYGSSYLRNHCTGSYYVKENPEDDGTSWRCKKDTLGALLEKFELHYDPEDYTSSLKGNLSHLSASDRLKLALRQFKTSHQTFTFKQLRGCLIGVSQSHLRRLLETPTFLDNLKKYKSNGKDTLYEVSGDI